MEEVGFLVYLVPNKRVQLSLPKVQNETIVESSYVEFPTSPK